MRVKTIGREQQRRGDAEPCPTHGSSRRPPADGRERAGGLWGRAGGPPHRQRGSEPRSGAGAGAAASGLLLPEGTLGRRGAHAQPRPPPRLAAGRGAPHPGSRVAGGGSVSHHGPAAHGRGPALRAPGLPGRAPAPQREAQEGDRRTGSDSRTVFRAADPPARGCSRAARSSFPSSPVIADESKAASERVRPWAPAPILGPRAAGLGCG